MDVITSYSIHYTKLYDLYAGFGKSPIQNLTFVHKIFDRSGNIFNRHLRVNAVLIEEIDAIRNNFV